MIQKEITDGNKLIAKFMGWVFKKGLFTTQLSNSSGEYYDDEVEETIWWDADGFPKEDGLRFHRSWNELMPVVEKIESMGNHFPIEKNGALVSAPYPKEEEKSGLYCVTEYIEGKTKIEATWKAVVEFLKLQGKK